MFQSNIIRRNKKTLSFCGRYYIKAMETYCVNCKNMLLTKNQVSKKKKKD